MVSLIAKHALSGQAPLALQDLHFQIEDLGPITSIAPFNGQESALNAVLEAGHGLRFPVPNTSTQQAVAKLLWSGRGQALVVGVAPDARLAAHAAVTDQSDGWVTLGLEGARAEAVLARLVAVDLRLTACPVGASLRAQVQHIPALIHRAAPQVFHIMVMRSFGQSAWHEVSEAMRGVAAR